jgi:hypothetical protein
MVEGRLHKHRRGCRAGMRWAGYLCCPWRRGVYLSYSNYRTSIYITIYDGRDIIGRELSSIQSSALSFDKRVRDCSHAKARALANTSTQDTAPRPRHCAHIHARMATHGGTCTHMSRDSIDESSPLEDVSTADAQMLTLRRVSSISLYLSWGESIYRPLCGLYLASWRCISEVRGERVSHIL